MKKILFIIFVSVLVFIIYFALRDQKVYYVSIGDYYNSENKLEYNYTNYILDYLDEINKLEKNVSIMNNEYRVTDIIKLINENEKINDKNIKNILIKSDLITLSIGYSDILTKVDKYDNFKINKLINNYIIDLENLFILLRKYCKEEIVMIGYYNIFENKKYEDSIKYLNRLTEELCDKYGIKFVNIEEMILYSYSYYPTMEGEHIIFNKIRKIIDKYVL